MYCPSIGSCAPAGAAAIIAAAHAAVSTASPFNCASRPALALLMDSTRFVQTAQLATGDEAKRMTHDTYLALAPECSRGETLQAALDLLGWELLEERVTSVLPASD